MSSDNHHRIHAAGRVTLKALLVLAGASLGVLAVASSSNAGAPSGGKPGTWMPGSFKFMGNASCVACHSEGKKKGGSNGDGEQFDIWEKDDPHHLSFEVLSNDESKKIAGKMGIADATKSDDCLNCHAVNAPADKRGAKWSIEEGNSCESCHGPGEKYLTPHEAAGWTAEQRKSKSPEQLMNEFGLFDTTNYAVRAAMCINCHLNIDKKLIDAGHPALSFEMSSYNYYSFDASKGYKTHWEEEPKTMADAKLWAVGQAAALEAAKQGGNAELIAIYTTGTGIAKKHFGSDTPDGLNKAAYAGDKAAGAAKDLAAAGAAAKSALERKIIAAGVFALTASTFDARGDAIPDGLYDANDAAIKGEEGPGYADALKKMAEMAK
ncbi:MAG: multiheme c-type cytochrome [Phycisphaerales bacterium]